MGKSCKKSQKKHGTIMGLQSEWVQMRNFDKGTVFSQKPAGWALCL
jgi:hypothetical protein